MNTRNMLWKSALLLAGAGLVVSAASGRASPAASVAAVPAVQPAPAIARVADATGGTAGRDANGAEAAQSRNAARSRMRECGHQWSTMKKSGAASGMTWKDFSQGCLAKQ